MSVDFKPGQFYGVPQFGARGAPDCASSPTLIFNPPGTTHRDRFTNGLGTFVTVSVGDATFEDLRRTLPLATEATRLGSNAVAGLRVGDVAADARVSRRVRGCARNLSPEACFTDTSARAWIPASLAEALRWRLA